MGGVNQLVLLIIDEDLYASVNFNSELDSEFDSAQENQLDAMDENDEDFEVLEVEFTDKETEVTE
jgi:hypothetical protein